MTGIGDERASGVAVLPAGREPARERAPGVAVLPAGRPPTHERAPGAPGRSGGRVSASRSTTSPPARSTPSRPAPSTPSRPARLPARPAPASGPGWGVQLVVLIAGVFMSILDTSIVNVAMPVIRKDFGVTIENVQWISTAYNLSEGVVVPISAWLGARFGLKRVYVGCLALFTLASALCGMAGGLGSLIFFRVVQAIPGGILPVIAVTILYRIVPTEKLGTAMGLYGLGAVVAPGIGPTLGGYLVEHFSWPVIFYINAPVGVLGSIAAAALLRGFPGQANRPFDLPGFACIAVAMFALLLALEEGPIWGWTSYPILILFAAAMNLLALFVVVELQVAHPMLDVRVFTRWPFVNSLLLISAMSLGMNAVLFYVPAFLQNIQGLSAWQTGLVLLPQALIMMALMPVSGRLYDRFGARWPAVVGLSLTGGGILLLSRINVDIPRSELIAALVVMFAGLALGMMPVMTGGLSALSAQATDTGSALNTLTQRVSAALGLAVLTALVKVDQAQFFADRAALLPATGANIPSQITQLRHSGPAGLIPLWQQLTNEVTAQAYSNAFFLTGWVTLAGIVLAVLLRTARPAPGAAKPIVH